MRIPILNSMFYLFFIYFICFTCGERVEAFTSFLSASRRACAPNWILSFYDDNH